MDQFIQDLLCPITGDFLEDPVSVPCCGKAFGREALYGWFLSCTSEDNPFICPSCRGDLEGFDVTNAAKNVVLAGLVESYRAKDKIPGVNTMGDSQFWSNQLNLVRDKEGKLLPIANLKISLEKSKFQVKPSLFIAVVDRSGSMGGAPWRQVETALLHVMGLTRSNPLVKTVIVAYQSIAEIINTSGTQEQVTQTIKTMFTGGGTNFSAAFDKVSEVLDGYMCSDREEHEHLENNVSNVTVAFMTDGQSGGNREKLVEDFTHILKDCWIQSPKNRENCPISVHSIGFGAGCDKILLEELRKTGSMEGTFRYAEPNDDGDTLCHKLTSLFEVASKSSSVPIEFQLTDNGMVFRITKNNYNDKMGVQFPVDKNRRGNINKWVGLSPELFDELRKMEESNTLNDKILEQIGLGNLIINSHLDQNVNVPLLLNSRSLRKDKEFNQRYFNKYLALTTDELASELLDLSRVNRANYGINVFDLHCALIQQKVEALTLSASEPELIERLDFISNQVNDLRAGLEINMGKLGDMRFSSQFGAIQSSNKEKPKPIGDISNPVGEIPQIPATPHWRELSVHYSRNNTHKNRNNLQKAITDNPCNLVTEEFQTELEKASMNDILFADVDGNNALHLAAYCGQIDPTQMIIKRILEERPDLGLNMVNDKEETPLTLAIKKRGFHKTVGTLLDAGATFPANRKKGLEQFAINNGFIITAQIISDWEDTEDTNNESSAKVSVVNESMTPGFIKYSYERIKEKANRIDLESYFKVCLSKSMNSMIKTLLDDYPTAGQELFNIQWLLDYCIPPKPDHPEVDVYLELAQLFLDHKPQLIEETNADGESPLFVAAEKGNLPHVQFFINRGAADLIDKPNNMGNTPLWVACAKRYPCIIDELLENGADPNWTNLKGNPPLYSICQKGPIKVAETLLAHGARVDHINENGDTLVLLSCRNGQHEILKLFLDYVDPEFVDFKAHIDGFNAILASTEADRPECIGVLAEYGVDLNQRTDKDNPIIANATPLHLAAYYGRTEAAKMLLSLGANPELQDSDLRTPLHIAVIQGHIPIVKLLRNYGAKIMVKDSTDNTPMSYCRNRNDIRDVLINPGLDILMKLANGSFSKDEEKKACQLLMNESGIIGCLSSKEVVDLIANDGSTPLLQSIIYSNYPVAETLLKCGADPQIKNNFGLNSHFYAHQTKNPRIHKLLGSDQEESNTLQCIQRIMVAVEENKTEMTVMFLGIKPKEIITLLSSGISQRMENFLNSIILLESGSDPDCLSDQKEFLDYQEYFKYNYDSTEDIQNHPSANIPNNKSLIKVFNNSDKFKDNVFNNLIWNSKIFTIGMVASGQNSLLTPQQIFALNIYTSNSLLSNEINQQLFKKEINDNMTPFITTLYESLNGLPSFQGEVFLGSNDVIRKNFSIGSTITWPMFLSASTLWKVALEHLEQFTDKKKLGTVFILKSKTGKFIGQYSSFSFDGEVIFSPNTKFKVKAWYRGDVICLGQANIREYTFGLKPEEIDQYQYNNKSMIIELEEVP